MTAPPGEFGKPRPAIVMQAEISLVQATVTYIPITSDLGWLPRTRVRIEPLEENGLRVPSEAMVDIIQTSSVRRVGRVIGRVNDATMQAVETALMVHLGLV